MRHLIITMILFLATIIVFYVFESGVERQEEQECYKWQRQAEEIRMGWQAPDWEISQCEKYGISLQQ